MGLCCKYRPLQHSPLAYYGPPKLWVEGLFLKKILYGWSFFRFKGEECMWEELPKYSPSKNYIVYLFFRFLNLV